MLLYILFGLGCTWIIGQLRYFRKRPFGGGGDQSLVNRHPFWLYNQRALYRK
jgi:hypothetical protein